MKDKNKRGTGGGRPRTQLLDLPVYDSMAQMAADTGIPMEVLKFTKRKGCMFVRHGRCELGVFLKWFFTQSKPGENTDWAGRDKRAGALMKEIHLERLRKTVVDFAEADKFIKALVSLHFFGELARLRNEFPGGLKGKDEIGVATEVNRQIGMIEQNLLARLDEWDSSNVKPEEVEQPESEDEEQEAEGDE